VLTRGGDYRYNRARSSEVRVRSAVAAVVLGLAVPASAGTVAGRVDVLDKGGRRLGDLSDVVVYLEGAKARPRPGHATVTMKGKAFTPRVLAVGVGTTVDFPNEDPIFHNVFSVSGDNRFDLDLYKRPKSGSWTFQHPGVARVYCNIHPQMSAVVLVRDNPFFTKAGPDGSFALEGVPAGRYVLKAWHERGGETATEVTVPADGRAAAELHLDASSYKQLPHKNKYGKDYSSDEKY
jgi:plastocyanin